MTEFEQESQESRRVRLRVAEFNRGSWPLKIPFAFFVYFAVRYPQTLAIPPVSVYKFGYSKKPQLAAFLFCSWKYEKKEITMFVSRLR